MEPPFSLAVVVDDDPDIALAARLALRDLFERVETLRSPAELLPLLKKESPDAILLDLNFERGATNGREGLDFLGRIMEQEPDAAVVIITAHGAVSIAVEALKAGEATSLPSRGATSAWQRRCEALPHCAAAGSMRVPSAAGRRSWRRRPKRRCSANRRRWSGCGR